MQKPGLGTRDPGLGKQHDGSLWRPSATIETLRRRAELFSSVRIFFAQRGVLEVDTPMLSHYATVDRHIESFTAGATRPEFPVPNRGWLHTSPEFAMKRLLCAGSGPIFQICHVFRHEECGRQHNPEFTMLEWYRPGFDHHALMDEVEALLRAVATALGPGLDPAAMPRLSYREAYEQVLGLDPHHARPRQLAEALAVRGHRLDGMDLEDRELWLDLAMSLAVAPQLGRERPCFLYDFPASQAALARIRPGDPPVAERFELIWRGVELANGFHELGDAIEQRARFQSEQAARAARGQVVPPYDEHLIAALAEGLPPCAGVAVGLDRVLMLLLDKPTLAEVLPFEHARA